MRLVQQGCIPDVRQRSRGAEFFQSTTGVAFVPDSHTTRKSADLMFEARVQAHERSHIPQRAPGACDKSRSTNLKNLACEQFVALSSAAAMKCQSESASALGLADFRYNTQGSGGVV